jgi:hypothetical protein
MSYRTSRNGRKLRAIAFSCAIAMAGVASVAVCILSVKGA